MKKVRMIVAGMFCLVLVAVVLGGLSFEASSIPPIPEVPTMPDPTPPPVPYATVTVRNEEELREAIRRPQHEFTPTTVFLANDIYLTSNLDIGWFTGQGARRVAHDRNIVLASVDNNARTITVGIDAWITVRSNSLFELDGVELVSTMERQVDSVNTPAALHTALESAYESANNLPAGLYVNTPNPFKAIYIEQDIELWYPIVIHPLARVALVGVGEENRKLTFADDGVIVTVLGSLSIENVAIVRTGFMGGSVDVARSGTFVMHSGEIRGRCYGRGLQWGVRNRGTFIMYDGIIQEHSRGVYNTSGGWYNGGRFFMHGGVIRRNSINVYNRYHFRYPGTFIMYGGTITENNIRMGAGDESSGLLVLYGELTEHFTTTMSALGFTGHGVQNEGIFIMHDGVISNNVGRSGGGVSNSRQSVFVMHGGYIENNIGFNGGGIENWQCSTFTMYGGTIRGNVAPIHGVGGAGGGIRNDGIFYMHGGRIYNNVAEGNGGGVFNFRGVFTLTGGWIFDNLTQRPQQLGNMHDPNNVTFGDERLRNQIPNPQYGGIGVRPPD